MRSSKRILEVRIIPYDCLNLRDLHTSSDSIMADSNLFIYIEEVCVICHEARYTTVNYIDGARFITTLQLFELIFMAILICKMKVDHCPDEYRPLFGLEALWHNIRNRLGTSR